MRHRTSRSIRLAVGLTAGATLALAACGSDGGGGASNDAFCDQITALAGSGGETTEEQDLAALIALADVAPGEISDEMDQLVDAFEQLQTFDPEAASDDEMADFLALAGSLDDAGTTVEEYATENCPDLPEDLFSTE